MNCFLLFLFFGLCYFIYYLVKQKNENNTNYLKLTSVPCKSYYDISDNMPRYDISNNMSRYDISNNMPRYNNSYTYTRYNITYPIQIDNIQFPSLESKGFKKIIVYDDINYQGNSTVYIPNGNELNICFDKPYVSLRAVPLYYSVSEPQNVTVSNT